MIHEPITINTASPNAPEASLLLVYTGGTLGMNYDPTGALVPFDFNEILDQVPSLRFLNLSITVISFIEPIDSSNILPNDWASIGGIIRTHYHDYDGFVVLHGTDTMAFTASALSFMLQGLNKPVVLTGAQLPISVPRTDARENLITALNIAIARQDGIPMVPEVSIYFHSVLLRGNRSKKVESVHFNAFESENYPILAESGVIIDYNHPAIMPYRPDAELVFRDKFDQNVSIIKLFPGICREVVEASLKAKGLKGVVLETYGAGNAPTDKWFLDILQEAVDNDIIILNVSQCTGGAIMEGRYVTSKNLKEIGILSGNDITTEAAVTKMMHLFGEYHSAEEVKRKIIKPLCGEMA